MSMEMAKAKNGSNPNRKKNTVPDLNLNLRSEKHCFTIWETAFEVYSKYEPIKPVGKGAYGVVCSSMNTETNQKVAIKKNINVFENRVEALRALRELIILRHTNHENVIGLKDVMVSNSNLVRSGLIADSKENFKDVYMVYELMDTDLHHIIKSSQPLSNDHCQYFLLQLLRGLNYLHSASILHRDLKPSNLLVNADCDLKICDFGLARTTTTEPQLMTDYVVTRWYRAPEVLLCCNNYGPSIDIWSVGCIFAELLGRKTLFRGTDSLHQLKLILEILGTQPESNLGFIDNNSRAMKFIKSLPYCKQTKFGWFFPEADPLGLDLLEKMLIFDPTKRITVAEALQHPYMSDLYDSREDYQVAQFKLDINIDENVGEKIIRELMWEEMLCFHPEEATNS